MPKQIIKDAALVEDNWILIERADEAHKASELPEGDLILPVQTFNALIGEPELNGRNIAVWIDSDQAPSEIGVVEEAAFVAINFPAFADGRGYSYAHKLRMQHDYNGEIRAIGDVLQDQLFYMKRVGFNSFAMREDQNLEQAIERLNDFNLVYQGAVDIKEPLFASR